jgi:hypothetical protein
LTHIIRVRADLKQQIRTQHKVQFLVFPSATASRNSTAADAGVPATTTTTTTQEVGKFSTVSAIFFQLKNYQLL